MAIVLSGSTNDILVNGVSVATDAEVSSAVAPKANTTDLKEIGVGQTWQNVTASRALGTTYTNSTEKPIVISITYYRIRLNIIVGGVSVTTFISPDGSDEGPNVSVIVPVGSTYSVSRLSGSYSVVAQWIELR